MSDTTKYEFWCFSVAAMIGKVPLISYNFGVRDWSVNAISYGGGSRIRLNEACVGARVVSACRIVTNLSEFFSADMQLSRGIARHPTNTTLNLNRCRVSNRPRMMAIATESSKAVTIALGVQSLTAEPNLGIRTRPKNFTK